MIFFAKNWGCMQKWIPKSLLKFHWQVLSLFFTELQLWNNSMRFLFNFIATLYNMYDILLCISTACPVGQYGDECQGVCQCRNDAVCDPATGRCQCGPGWTGDQCDLHCSEGRYGPDCSLVCDCLNGAGCDPVSGCCDCTSGWYGTHCEHRMYDNVYLSISFWYYP